MRKIEVFSVWLLGGLVYCGIELMWRGSTHWTMLVLGGICFFVMYGVNVRMRLPLPVKWLICAAAVTAMEFTAGCLLNLWLGWNIWSYRALPWNLLGQICPLYAFFWFLLSIPGALLSRLMYRIFHPRTAAAPLPYPHRDSRITFPAGISQARTRREWR